MKNYILVSLFIFSFLVLSCENNKADIPETESKVSFIAYYFHPTPRCPSCLNLESFTKELIETKYTKTPFVFKSINIDEEENEHYKTDFDLVFSSLVLVKYKNGSQVKWKNLESVWSYTADKEKFFGYTENEIKNFIKD